MMSDESGERHDMTDAEWEILRQVLPTGRPGPVRRNDRQVMDGIFYILRSGAPWRDLPPRYGPRTPCFNRYNRWSKDGTWAEITNRLQRLFDSGDPPGGGEGAVKERMIDSSTVRVHKLGAGSWNDGTPREIGRSRGGPTTKIHVAVDGCGQPQVMHLSPGQAADCTQAPALLGGLAAGTIVIADKAYDTDAILDQVARAGGVAAIPSKANRRAPREINREAYARRNLVERFFCRIKEFRRVATRYEKRARNFMATVMLAAARYTLRTLAKQMIESTP